jgi:hypothetical protein
LPHAIELRQRYLSQEVLVSSLGSDDKIPETESPLRGELEPGLTAPDRDARIREIAYFLWLDEGCPHGEDERHWTSAEALLDSEPQERKRIEGEPPGEPLAEAPPVPKARRGKAA